MSDKIHPGGVPMQALNCVQPFESKGTYVMQVNYSGGSASSDFIPANKFLEIRRVKATLRGAVLSAGNLSLTASGTDDWYDMRLENGAVVYSASKDGALYADRGTRIKFVAYRNSGYDQALTGDYVMSGCLVDKLPPITTQPDFRAPRLPRKKLTPVEPVERPRDLQRKKAGSGD
ncbi:MAG: hypothetical protein ABI858_08190 [Pseudoxanthomonas sp.]